MIEAKEILDSVKGLLEMKNAHEDWRDYRRNISDFITGYTIGGCNIAVLGAGQCNDIELPALCSHFSYVTLMDEDLEKMQKAVATMENGLDYLLEGKIRLIKCNFTGICDAHYLDFINAVLAILESFTGNKPLMTFIKEDVEEAAKKKLVEIYNDIRDFQIEDNFNEESLPLRFDYSLTLGVHSQLNNMFALIWECIIRNILGEAANDYLSGDINTNNIYKNDIEKNNNSNYNGSVFELISENTMFIEKKFNRFIKSITKTDSFIGLEDGNIDGAYQAELDLRTEMTDRTYVGPSFVWSFDKASGKEYKIKMYKLT